MNFLDLFGGIGGFALGAEWAGLRFDRHYYSEVDAYAQRVYALRFPDAVGLGDIRNIRGADLPEGEWILAGGFPCQDISVAGKGAGLAGARSGLWYEYARLIGELRPRFAIMENVGALAFRGLDSVLGSLAEIGYDAEWQDIRASDVGAPHRRERIWIVAYPECTKRGPECFTRDGLAQREDCLPQREKSPSRARISGEDVADAASGGRGQRDKELRGPLEGKREAREWCRSSDGGEVRRSRAGAWLPEPDVGRVAHGVPARVDRLKCLGNSIVPQIAELIFREIATAGRRKEQL